MTVYDPDYEPRLFDADGDLSKRWYIDFRVWDTDKQAFVRKQYTGMNKLRRVEASEQHRPYTEAQRQQIRQAAVEASGDAQQLLFISFFYYCFIRSGGELRLRQLKNIRAATVRIPSERSKHDKGST